MALTARIYNRQYRTYTPGYKEERGADGSRPPCHRE